MPRRLTMTAIVTRCQQRADMESDSSISTSEWYALVSEAYGTLYTDVIESGMEYFETAVQLTTTGVNYLSEPVDHLSTVTLAYLADATTGRYRALRELMAQERTVMSGIASTNWASCFALVDDKIYLYPTPPAGQVYELRYVPQSPDLTTYAGTDTVDVVVPEGEAYLVWSVVVKALSKSETDTTLAEKERDASRERFVNTCQLRALNAPRRRITDIEVDGFNFYDWYSESFPW